MPPLKYEANFFELVYSFSVFSHLTRVAEEAWLEELRRVGKAGCLYLLTVHGDWFIEATLADADRAAALRDGFLFRKIYTRHDKSGSAAEAWREVDFPEYYEFSYHTSDDIRREWAKHFDILAVIRGDSAGYYNSENLVAPPIRPMGQDMVVARKR